MRINSQAKEPDLDETSGETIYIAPKKQSLFIHCAALSIPRENLSGQWYGDALVLSASPFLIFRKGEIIYGKENSAL